MENQRTRASDEEAVVATGGRLVYAPVAHMNRWGCRPLGTIDVMDLQDRRVGQLDGIVLDRDDNRPAYLSITRMTESGGRGNGFLVPVGDAWFDGTARAVRVDTPARERLAFDPDEFVRMTPDQANAYERRVLAECCPEVGFHRDGRPDYARLSRFECPAWLRE
jgi:hypothetical protein